MKCWNWGFNAKGSIVIIVVGHVAAVEALKKKERQDENQFTTKIAGILSFCPPPATPCMTKLRGSGAVFSFLYRYSNVQST
jgi:hypothetical protein